jgi:hypothetical protein
MMLTTWPARALFKYVYKRVLGTYIKTDLNLDDIDFSTSSFAINDIEMNTYEINKMLSSEGSSPPFKLVSMTLGSVDIPWALFKFNPGMVKLDRIEVIVMP